MGSCSLKTYLQNQIIVVGAPNDWLAVIQAKRSYTSLEKSWWVQGFLTKVGQKRVSRAHPVNMDNSARQENKNLLPENSNGNWSAWATALRDNNTYIKKHSNVCLQIKSHFLCELVLNGTKSTLTQLDHDSSLLNTNQKSEIFYWSANHTSYFMSIVSYPNGDETKFTIGALVEWRFWPQRFLIIVVSGSMALKHEIFSNPCAQKYIVGYLSFFNLYVSS